MPRMAGQSTGWPADASEDISGYDQPLFSLLDAAASARPDQTYTIFNGGRRTFAQVRHAADRVACFLGRRGLKPGDRVAVFLPNVPHYPEILFGILKAGAICVPCNPVSPAEELRHQLLDSGAVAAFCLDHQTLYPKVVEALEGTRVETVVICSVASHLPRLKSVIGGLLRKIPKAESLDPEHVRYETVLAESGPEDQDPAVDPRRDPAVIIYTGGSTGTPKGACLTHANLLFNVLAVRSWAGYTRGAEERPEPLRGSGSDCFLGVLPWHHSLGLTAVLLLSCHLTAGLVCAPDPQAGVPAYTDLLMSIRKYRGSVLVAFPALYAALIGHAFIDKVDLSSLQLCLSGGASLPREAAQAFEDKTGAPIVEAYGLSEAPLVTAEPPDAAPRRSGSVGPPLPGTELAILDLEAGQIEQPRGQVGQVAVSGPQVMSGYWQRPRENAEAFRTIKEKRFLLTGDEGRIDRDGWLVITGRKEDIS